MHKSGIDSGLDSLKHRRRSKSKNRILDQPIRSEPWFANLVYGQIGL